MLESIVANHDFIKQVKLDDDYPKLQAFTKDEILIVKDMIQILKPFDYATQVVSVR